MHYTYICTVLFYLTGLHSICHVPYDTLSISFLFFLFFLQCPHLYICIVCMYICLNCIYLYLNVYCQCLMLTVCTKGLRVTQFQFSVCMYCTCGRIDNKADLTWLDYSPREFSSFILVNVYVPLDACVSATMQQLAEQISETEQRYPDTLLIILGDFNKENLSRELPKYRQHITCPTRDSNILDYCYTIIKDAYHSVPRAALGLSDHCLVHLIPTYRQKLKSSKPVLRTVRRWTNEAEQDLRACFDLTDWSVFEATATDLDELTETVTSYISFCEDICIPTMTFLSFNNDKSWFTGKLKQLRQAKEDAYRSGDKILYNQVRNRLTNEIRVAKNNYSEKLKKILSANDPASVWTGLRNITMYKTPPPQSVENQQLADDLNVFYCRFEKARLTPSTHSDLHFTHSPSPPATPLTPSPTILPALKVCVEDVNRVFRKQKSRKVSGPDGISPACLKVCADQLAPIFTQIFNRSLELCEVPCCFKRSTIIPVPKSPKSLDLMTTDLSHSRLWSWSHLRDWSWPTWRITRSLLDPLQFAYRAKRSVDDAVNMGLHYILQHLDKPGNYARILFVDFSSTFNTIMPDLLSDKLTQLSVPTSICQWNTSFLTDSS